MLETSSLQLFVVAVAYIKSSISDGEGDEVKKKNCIFDLYLGRFVHYAICYLRYAIL